MDDMLHLQPEALNLKPLDPKLDAVKELKLSYPHGYM